MAIYPKPIRTLVELLQSLPAVGPKTAERYTLALRAWPAGRQAALAKAVAELADRLETCAACGVTILKTKDEPKLCEICQDPRRQSTLLCIVEREPDAAALEKTELFKGQYFILNGVLSPTKANAQTSRRLAALKKRLLAAPKVMEVILALNPTPLGDATALIIQRLAAGLKIKITRLGRGLSFGAQVDYADATTLANALKFRQTIKPSARPSAR